MVKHKVLKCLASRAVYVFLQCYEKQSFCCALLTCSNFSFSNTFHILRPTKAPGFVYAWLELISHRIFIARMLAHTPQQKVWLQSISSELKRSHRCLSSVVLFHISESALVAWLFRFVVFHIHTHLTAWRRAFVSVNNGL